MVKRWVDFYKQHRAILESDIIHIRRPDAQDYDAILHVNPALPERGFAVVHNPLGTPITRTIRLPLYYTGLTTAASVRVNAGTANNLTLARDYSAEVTVTIPADGLVWVTLSDPSLQSQTGSTRQ
jgi:hypothetical protein